LVRRRASSLAAMNPPITVIVAVMIP